MKLSTAYLKHILINSIIMIYQAIESKIIKSKGLAGIYPLPCTGNYLFI